MRINSLMAFIFLPMNRLKRSLLLLQNYCPITIAKNSPDRGAVQDLRSDLLLEAFLTDLINDHDMALGYQNLAKMF